MELTLGSLFSGIGGFELALASSVWKMAKHLKGYSLTWKMRGITTKYFLFQLAVSERGIGEIESGLLPTMKESDHCNRTQFNPDLTGKKAKIKSTNNRPIQIRLSQYVKMFPTPIANDSKLGNKFARKRKYNSLTETILEMENTGKLNPAWVEWLMGVPVGWTDLKHLETGKSWLARLSSDNKLWTLKEK